VVNQQKKTVWREKGENSRRDFCRYPSVFTCFTFCYCTPQTWLPNEWRIRFKLVTMTFKALHTPPYLTDQLQYYQPTKSLRSTGSHQLVKPRYNLSFGSCAFRISAPHIWNSLPTNIREAMQSSPTFTRHLKTHYFQSAFSTPYSDAPANAQTLILFKILVLHKYFNYLLTFCPNDIPTIVIPSMCPADDQQSFHSYLQSHM